MPMNDLYQALQMFSSGVKEYQTSRAINSANDYVQQLKASDMNDQQKRAALQDVSNQLVTHLAASGTPATTLQAVAGAIGPKNYADANAMYRDAALSGDNNLARKALNARKVEDTDYDQNPAAPKEVDPLKAAQFGALQEDRANKTLTNFGKYLDANAQSSRTAFGSMGVTGNRSARIDALLGDPKQYATLNGQDASLIGEGLINQVKGGAATKEEMASIIPGLSAQPVANWKTWLSNNPEALHAPGVFDKFQQIASKEKNENDVQTADEILHRAGQNLHVAGMQGGKYQDQFKTTVANELSKYMPGVKPEDIIIDPKHGVTTPQMQQIEHVTTTAQSYLKKAYIGMNSSDPAAQQQALTVLQKFGVTPGMKYEDAQKLVERKVRRGDLGNTGPQ
jgi:hypothetical protein